MMHAGTPGKFDVSPVFARKVAADGEKAEWMSIDSWWIIGPFSHPGRQNLEELYKPWIEVMDKGVGVHCGECGCYSKTPHDIFLAWFTDVIDILTSAGIGYALWNFRGDFGIMDSNRTDIQYADWYGHKLDSKLLALLKKY
jgi:aryl-phospho-beta-D-glucosidase BglC (GH1 family)